jgi:hypothetical protein
VRPTVPLVGSAGRGGSRARGGFGSSISRSFYYPEPVTSGVEGERSAR